MNDDYKCYFQIVIAPMIEEENGLLNEGRLIAPSLMPLKPLLLAVQKETVALALERRISHSTCA